jgi:hypothetical protein
MKIEIKRIKSELKNTSGVKDVIVNTGYEVWIHILLERNSGVEDIKEKINSEEFTQVEFVSTYNIDSSLFRSNRTVIRAKI